jgi:hypothetical protein
MRVIYDRDDLTREYTAFGSFQELIDAPGGYFPTFDCCNQNVMRLADAYDIAQAERGDGRRVHRWQVRSAERKRARQVERVFCFVCVGRGKIGIEPCPECRGLGVVFDAIAILADARRRVLAELRAVPADEFFQESKRLDDLIEAAHILKHARQSIAFEKGVE